MTTDRLRSCKGHTYIGQGDEYRTNLEAKRIELGWITVGVSLEVGTSKIHHNLPALGYEVTCARTEDGIEPTCHYI